jgi:hypothetical protein
MREGIFVPQMIVIINLHAKSRLLLHERLRTGMVVKTIIFPASPNQTTSLVLAVNAAAHAVDLLPLSGLVIRLSSRTFWVHAEFVIDHRVDSPRILKTSQQIQPLPLSKGKIIPSTEVIRLQRDQSQIMTNTAINTLNDAHDVKL